MEVTRDPAMLLWLSGVDNEKGSPNENYARELMELFTLGADRGAYTEHDVREQARALTGFRYTWSDNARPGHASASTRSATTPATKRIFGKRGHFDWRDSCRLCVHHRLHPSFFVTKLWSYFVPVPPKRAGRSARSSGSTSRAATRSPRSSARSCATPRSTPGRGWSSRRRSTWPGLLRGLGRGIDTEAWTWLLELAGQQLFYPPNVAGWDDSRWLDTATFRARWEIAGYAMRPKVAEGVGDKHVPAQGRQAGRPRARRARAARRSPGRPRPRSRASPGTRSRDANAHWKKEQYPPLIENALRQLLATAPDLQTC